MHRAENVVITKDSSESCGKGKTNHASPLEEKTVAVKTTSPEVSTNYVCKRKVPHWYVLRTTYGRELLAYEFMKSHGVNVYCPTIKKTIVKDNKRKTIEESRLPNIFFAFGTEEELKDFVFDNRNLPFLRFYYRYYRPSENKPKEPLIVPEKQMQALMTICMAEDEDTYVSSDELNKFRKGDAVKITDGRFKGIEGVVARFRGQQRVGVVIKGIGTVVTAYIPSKILEHIRIKENPGTDL